MKNISKFLSLLLRHQPEKIQLEMDREGWVLVHQLLDKLNTYGYSLTQAELEEIVSTNDKQRFALSQDGLKIRASQGHTIAVDLKLKPQKPPIFLYHGTALDSVKAILKEGLKPQARNHVHLSADLVTATKVGERKGRVQILKILAQKMQFEGYKFYLSENGVWLADFVPPEYIKLD
jgi:putative RNA 2'-phosphotransferase